MKAIETRYKGYRFRSRLEARWAVFFDAIGLKWEYEPEGFEFKDGTQYLPDFWLPELHQWAEVKPEPLTGEEMRKVFLLSRHVDGFVLTLVGTPAVQPYEGFLACQMPREVWERDGKETWQPGILDSGIDEKYGTGLEVFWYLGSMWFSLNVKRMQSGSVFLETWTPDNCDLPSDVHRAVEVARSARFEFGEAG